MRPSPHRLAAFIVSNSLLLPIGLVAALLWANAAPERYVSFARSVRFIVNEVGMTLFFALAAKEIVEAMAPHGALHPVSKAATAVFAAVGGMIVPAVIYAGLFEEPQLPGRDPLTRFEHAARVPTEFVLFLFGLVNGGVPLAQIGAGTWIAWPRSSRESHSALPPRYWQEPLSDRRYRHH